ncbi:MAG: 5-formyltetrahydrofolate cyclo-ligase [Alphaproteobacteria bacterium]
MTDDIKTQKDNLRTEAKRARGLMSLNSENQKSFCSLFFEHISPAANTSIGFYWPKGREFDTQILMDECVDRGHSVSVPIVEAKSRILKFAHWDHNTELEKGAYDLLQPVLHDTTQLVVPDVFLVPLLAFDRKGYRLGYGGGYYDATLSYYREQKDILAVGVGYARQACLFNLPTAEHDIRMDWILTEQTAQCFCK